MKTRQSVVLYLQLTCTLYFCYRPRPETTVEVTVFMCFFKVSLKEFLLARESSACVNLFLCPPKHQRQPKKPERGNIDMYRRKEPPSTTTPRESFMESCHISRMSPCHCYRAMLNLNIPMLLPEEQIKASVGVALLCRVGVSRGRNICVCRAIVSQVPSRYRPMCCVRVCNLWSIEVKWWWWWSNKQPYS